jgi:hypothetical protein
VCSSDLFEAAIISDYDLWGLRRIIAIETDLFQIQAEILRDRRKDGTTTMHRTLPDQAPEVLAKADSLCSNGPALSPRELTTASCGSGIWMAARSSGLVATTPLCGSKRSDLASARLNPTPVRWFSSEHLYFIGFQGQAPIL